MVNLLLRSALVLALLFGLLFAIGVVVLTAMDAPLWIGLVFAVAIVLLQYLLGPWILQLIYKIEWNDPERLDPALARFIADTCAVRGIPVPRLGIIHDGNPNAFTFGHYPRDARLVVTTGLLDLLDARERQAVVAHELGHIAHWDFVVMTVAAVVPLVLYMVFRVTLGRKGDRRGKGSEYLAIVGIVSFVAYLISQYVVLLLSRVREYYADQFAGDVTGEPDALATALVKVAYGMAAAPKEKDAKKDDTRLVAARAFGIFDPKVAQSLALASAGSGAVSADTMESAMKWDLWNPWALLYELSSSHPLPAKRIRALERQTEAQGKVGRFTFRAAKPESYWDEFLVDVAVRYLPLLGLIVGLAVGGLWFGGWLGLEGYGAAGPSGLILLLVCGAWWLKRRFSYRHRFGEQRTVRSLVSEVKVSAVRSIPCTVEGTVIGRGIPGLFFSEDLVLQDESGFIVVDYRQPLRFLEFLFGWLKAQDLVGQKGKAMGWYRRSPRPYLEMRRLVLDGGKTVTSYVYPVTQFLVYAGMVLSAVLLVLHFV